VMLVPDSTVVVPVKLALMLIAPLYRYRGC
jgi:hypothetical protein